MSLHKRYYNSYSPCFNINHPFKKYLFHSWFPAVVAAVFSLTFSWLFPSEFFSVLHASETSKALMPWDEDQNLMIIPPQPLFIIFKKSTAFSFLKCFPFQINTEVTWELQLLLPLETDSTFLKQLLFLILSRNWEESLSCSPGGIYSTYKEIFTFHAIHSIREGKPQFWILKQDLMYNL